MKEMTVRELIEKLQTVPGDMLVCITHNDYGIPREGNIHAVSVDQLYNFIGNKRERCVLRWKSGGMVAYNEMEIATNRG